MKNDPYHIKDLDINKAQLMVTVFKSFRYWLFQRIYLIKTEF